MSSFKNPFRAWLETKADGRGERAELMKLAKATKSSWYKYLDGKDALSDTVLEWAANLGFQFIPPGHTEKPMDYSEIHLELERLRIENKKLQEDKDKLTQKLLNLHEKNEFLNDEYRRAFLEKNNKEGEATSPPSSKSSSVAPQKQTT